MGILRWLLVAACLTGCMTQRNGELRPSALPAITFTAAEYRNYTGTTLSGGRETVLWDEMISARSRNSDSEELRNRIDGRIARMLISKSDLICDNYFERVIVVRNQSVSGLQLAALAASGAVPLVTPDRSGRLLGGVASFLTGSRAALEETVFDGEDIRELRRAAMASRDQSRIDLLARLDAAGDGAARLALLEARIGDYHRQCGIEFGVDFRSSLVDQAAQAALAAQNRQNEQDSPPNGETPAANLAGADPGQAETPAGTEP